jgi:hypothetical protein
LFERKLHGTCIREKRGAGLRNFPEIDVRFRFGYGTVSFRI